MLSENDSNAMWSYLLKMSKTKYFLQCTGFCSKYRKVLQQIANVQTAKSIVYACLKFLPGTHFFLDLMETAPGSYELNYEKRLPG